MHVRYRAHIPPGNIFIECWYRIKHKGHVCDELRAPSANRHSEFLTRQTRRNGRTIFGNVFIHSKLEVNSVGKAPIGGCAGALQSVVVLLVALLIISVATIQQVDIIQRMKGISCKLAPPNSVTR